MKKPPPPVRKRMGLITVCMCLHKQSRFWRAHPLNFFKPSHMVGRSVYNNKSKDKSKINSITTIISIRDRRAGIGYSAGVDNKAKWRKQWGWINNFARLRKGNRFRPFIASLLHMIALRVTDLSTAIMWQRESQNTMEALQMHHKAPPCHPGDIKSRIK